MAIWQSFIDLATLHQRNQGSMSDFLGIQFTDIGDDYLKAIMPVQAKTHQARGIMHGGASCVLAETVASVAANYVVDNNTHYCVGLDINANHIRPVASGYVEAKTEPFHLGRTTQVWHIDIRDRQTHKLICVSRLTVAVISKQSSDQ